MSDEKPPADLELLKAAINDAEAFGEFYRRHALGLERWLRTQVPDIETTADLTAETFAQALVSLHRFRGDSDEAAVAWLFAIARNLVRRYHRKGRVELATCQKLGIQLEHDPGEFAEVEVRIHAAEHRSELARALAELPRDQRDALQSRVIDELGYPEAALLLGTSETNARMRVSRALRSLQKRLQGASL